MVDFYHIPTSTFPFQTKQSHFYHMSCLLNLLPCLLPLPWICIYSFSNEVPASGQSSSWGFTNTRQGAKQLLPNHLHLDQNSMIELTHNSFVAQSNLHILPCRAAVSDIVLWKDIICVFYFSCWSVALCPSPYFIPSSGFQAIPPFYPFSFWRCLPDCLEYYPSGAVCKLTVYVCSLTYHQDP